MWISKRNNILNLTGIYSFRGIYIHICILSMWLPWQGLWHTGGLSVGMGYLAHSSPSAWWSQRLIHWFPGWDGTQRQAICSSPQGFGAAADETNLINIDRGVGGALHSGCTVGNEVKSRRSSPWFLSLPPSFHQRDKKSSREQIGKPIQIGRIV